MNRKRKLNHVNITLNKKNKFIEDNYVHKPHNLQIFKEDITNKFICLDRINKSLINENEKLKNELLYIKKNFTEEIKSYTEKNNYLIEEKNLLKEQIEILSKKILELEESLINKQFSKIKIKNEIPSYIN